jgi:7-cyano-7-deazaguanine tRNA-ribosyltransferase
MVSLGDAVHRPQLVERVFCGDLKERLGVRGPLMLDSGGFTMMMQSRSLRISDIVKIYERTRAELCISLDVPPTSKDNRRVRTRKYQDTQKNFEHLVRYLDPSKLVPVIHGTNSEEIAKNCDRIAAIVANPQVVCLGGLVPLLRRSGRASPKRDRAFAWITRIVAGVRRQFPETLIHVLGAGSPQTVLAVLRCGADSTDSLAWRRAAGFGTIFLPGTSERFLSPRERKRATSRPTLNAHERELLAGCTCPACAELPQLSKRIAELSNSYLARAAHNAFIILQEAKTVLSSRKQNRVSDSSLVTLPL